MKSRSWAATFTIAATGVFALVLASGDATVRGQAGAARTPWGDPDLEGIWEAEAVPTPLERPLRFGTREMLNAQELAEAAKAAPVDQPNADEDGGGSTQALASHAPRDAAESASARDHEKALLGQEYNAWWQAGPRRRRATWNRTSLIVDPPDGRMPAFTPQALDRIAARDAARKGRSEADAPVDRNLSERCIGRILGGNVGGGAGVRQIVQAPGYVVMVPDGLTRAQVIPLDGRPQLDDRIRQWFGESRGHWEGDTLVVETRNINDRQDAGPIAPSHNDLLPGIHQHHYFGSGSAAKITERFTRVGPDRMEYRFTLDNPSVYLKPYTILRPLGRSDEFMILENACHEGNYGMTSLLSGGRANEKEALRAADAEWETRQQQLEVLRKKTAEALKASSR